MCFIQPKLALLVELQYFLEFASNSGIDLGLNKCSPIPFTFDADEILTWNLGFFIGSLQSYHADVYVYPVGQRGAPK